MFFMNATNKISASGLLVFKLQTSKLSSELEEMYIDALSSLVVDSVGMVGELNRERCAHRVQVKCQDFIVGCWKCKTKQDKN